MKLRPAFPAKEHIGNEKLHLFIFNFTNGMQKLLFLYRFHLAANKEYVAI